MSAAHLPLATERARPLSIRFAKGPAPMRRVTQKQVAAALENYIADSAGVVTLAGLDVDEADLNDLMDQMKEAAGLHRCPQCLRWADNGAVDDLCAECVPTCPNCDAPNPGRPCWCCRQYPEDVR